MCSRDELLDILTGLRGGLTRVFPLERPEMILFGSYARGDAEDGSDVDVLCLVDSPRHVIAEKNWQIGELASEALLEHGVVVSPIVENRAYYEENADILPFFRNIRREGVRLSV